MGAGVPVVVRVHMQAVRKGDAALESEERAVAGWSAGGQADRWSVKECWEEVPCIELQRC